jgi:hypothetical protein
MTGFTGTTGETKVRINELTTAEDVTRDWFVEVDQPENEELEESNKYSIDDLLTEHNATSEEYGTVKIGNENEVRNGTQFDHQNILTGNMLPLLFTRTYNVVIGDLIEQSFGANLVIKQWDYAVIGNMVFHNAVISFVVRDLVEFRFFTFANLEPNPPLGQYYPVSSIGVRVDSTEGNPILYNKIPAIFYANDVGGNVYTTLSFDVLASHMGVVDGTVIEVGINGWYFRGNA